MVRSLVTSINLIDVKGKAAEYYSQLDFATLSPKQAIEALNLFQRAGDAQVFKLAFGKVNLANFADRDKENLANKLYKSKPIEARLAIAAIDDADLQAMTFLRLSERDGSVDITKKIAWADKLKSNQEYVEESSWILGEELQRQVNLSKQLALTCVRVKIRPRSWWPPVL